MKSMARLVPHRTILQSPKVQGTTGQWMIQGSQTHQRWYVLAHSLPTLSLPHGGQLGSAQTDEVMPFLQLLQDIVVVGPPGMLDTVVFVPNPSGWATSPKGPESHSL